jgi:pyruvate dehydrogenase (quinone)
VPDDHPLTTGGLGLLGTKPSEAVMHECDTLLMVGTNFPYTAHLPEPGQARTVQIDSDPGFAEAFLRGQPDKLAVARTLVKDQVDKLRS